jgi:hypothetical protein
MLGVSLQIIESPAACTYERVRTYPKRRAKSARHWARMDKKWLKRYGMRAKPTAYLIDTPGVFDLDGGQALVVHPILAPQYLEAINSAFPLANSVDNFL